MAEQQNYANHVRWYPIVHFVIMPLLTLNFLYQSVWLYQEPSWDRGIWVVFCLTVILLSFAARLQALKAQDRTIRLEERLRYRDVLTAELSARAAELRIGQIIALRFASDAELPDMIRRVLDGELDTSKEIKMSIKNWRGDRLRV